ncbi:MAG: alpha-glucuronidase [Phenylobacterium sp.]|nr:MAG: alpha-glucuronidase [Phenylobacterium sp.]
MALLGWLLSAGRAAAEDGYDLWLRYRPLPAAIAQADAVLAGPVVAEGAGRPTLQAAQAELTRGLAGLLGPPSRPGAGRILIGTPDSSPTIAALHLPLDGLGPEGFLIRRLGADTVVAANRDVGVLYGAFRLLREVQTGRPVESLDIRDRPAVKLRLLDHWDNLNGTIERGYAGGSLWQWQKLPDHVDPRIADYARADASIGINGAVVNNVNASADSLTAPYIGKAAALADVLRHWGVKLYLSVRWSAPIEIGGLATADPLDPAVAAWWRAKADEIYRAIPDFGGFLVKANSEGQPGPQDYGRNHVDGANMLADALAPHGGVVMWRAFVYSSDPADDRAKQAYREFKPLDGRFRPNVLLQVKNGPIDFQPREPFHPLFGAMPKTPLMLELQVTKEYLGQGTHLVYLGPLFAEVLGADTGAKGPGSTVARVVDGELDGHALSGMAGVANTGADRDWSGSIFDQADWYAFGRLAWDPTASPRAIAEDWTRMTFSLDPAFVAPVVGMMLGSRQAAVDYMTPLGLHHLMARDTHYGPAPWDVSGKRLDWRPPYYHRADAGGIGFDRTASGSDAIGQYSAAAAARFLGPSDISEDDLLWFRHLLWDYRTASGRTLWDELVTRYDRGLDAVIDMRRTWAGLAPYVDAERYRQTADLLRLQETEARWWRDASIAYFQSLSHRPLPAGHAAPRLPLAAYEAVSFPPESER